MTVTPYKAIALPDFLKLPETQPASEYLDGKVIQKPMPKARHSRLQNKLIQAINEVAEEAQIAYGFSELRCTFGNRSLVPDVAVFRWERIAFDEDGEPIDDVEIAPDWVIEILSPQQSANRVTGKILHCLHYGCQLGWLVDPSDRSILVFQPQQEPMLCEGSMRLRVLEGVELDLRCDRVFGWLKMGKSSS
ncbi:hypothetical protein CKA32_005788 [Geitlerinema sp. FC II]|nr:Uma2 family endonuclease [Geitlerinema sp. CS-897]PPT08798.1 hypothetical protein CKA32_005788 [Geitlerinema sp. FC II]